MIVVRELGEAVAMQRISPDALLLKAQLLRLQRDPAAAMTVLDGLIAAQPGATSRRWWDVMRDES